MNSPTASTPSVIQQAMPQGVLKGIKSKEKQLKKMKEKNALKNLKLKNIELRSQAMAENFNKSIFTVYDI